MFNITYTFKGDALVITVPDFKAQGRPSGSGKTNVIASTEGWGHGLASPDGAQMTLALNLYRPKS